ncbi:MAG: 3-deoxy-D-manno-octulosonic acid transferase [Phycisphaerales bacterium JB052]
MPIDTPDVLRSTIVPVVNLLDLLYIPLGLVTAPLWLRKRREGWDERFGHVDAMFDPEGIDTDLPCVMLHSVSVGEVNALRALVPMLSGKAHVFVSSTTDTGLARARSLFGTLDHVSVVRYPLDCSWMVKRFLNTVQPDVVGLVELEVWPNFIKICHKREIPIGIINGRISARSYKGYRKLRVLLRPTFSRLSFACVQDGQYAERIEAMGVPKERVSITGSMKWDSISTEPRSEPSERAKTIAREMGVDLSRPIVVAGSTGPNEEGLMHEAVPDDVQLIIAPRKTERFDEAARAVPGCVRRSSGEQGMGASRFLLDTIGELSAVYELADLVIMGRSFNDQYGSDPIEPAASGKPVLIGERHSDFQVAIELLTQSGGLRVVERDHLGRVVQELLGDADLRAQMGRAAQGCVRAQQGATGRHMDVLLRAVIRPDEGA